jgi:hypothetical protein
MPFPLAHHPLQKKGESPPTSAFAKPPRRFPKSHLENAWPTQVFNIFNVDGYKVCSEGMANHVDKSKLQEY